jgi:hypothetical protein
MLVGKLLTALGVLLFRFFCGVYGGNKIIEALRTIRHSYLAISILQQLSHRLIVFVFLIMHVSVFQF